MSNANLKPFKKGQSGNPKGREPGTLSLITLLKQGLQEINKTDDKDKKTKAQTLIQGVLEKAIDKGDKDMVKLIFNYIEGLPKQSIEHSGELEISLYDQMLKDLSDNPEPIVNEDDKTRRTTENREDEKQDLEIE